MAVSADARTPNEALIALREDVGLSQEELAEALNELAAKRHKKYPNITKKTVGRWERGEVVWPQPLYRRLLAECFDCAVDELGFQRPRRAETPRVPRTNEALTLVATPGAVDARVEQDQQRWQETRKVFGQHRRDLAVAAEKLYPEYGLPSIAGIGAITHPSWILEKPLPLSEVCLELDHDETDPGIDGTEPASAHVRPLASAEQRYRRYSHAVRDLAAPKLFENRLCYRLTEVDWQSQKLRLQFGKMGFFGSIDINEPLAHEAAAQFLARNGNSETEVGRPSWRRLSFRKLISDPFDLARRPLMGAIGTLTIRAGDSPSMILHQRDSGRVAGGGGMAHLLPAGIFQPSSVLPESIANDFSIWRNVQREFAEELLGHVEYDGSGRPIDYENGEPFGAMNRAYAEGKLRIHFLGLALDALTLSGEILTVAVIEPDTYDELFGEAVDRNDEGVIPARSLPFEGNTIARLHELSQLSPGAAVAIHLAWQHRKTLLPR